MTTSSTMKPSPIRYASNKEVPKRCRAKIQITSQGRVSKGREVCAKDAIRGLHMERMDQTDKFSTAYETTHRKEKADVQNKKEHEKWLEGSSRFVEQHVEKSDNKLDNLQREGMLGLS